MTWYYQMNWPKELKVSNGGLPDHRWSIFEDDDDKPLAWLNHSEGGWSYNSSIPGLRKGGFSSMTHAMRNFAAEYEKSYRG